MKAIRKLLCTAFLSASVFLPQNTDKLGAQTAHDVTPKKETPTEKTVVAKDQDKTFAIWLKEIRAKAKAAGISQATIHSALPLTLKSLESTIALDSKQPEGTVTLDQYLAKRVTPGVIARAKKELTTHRVLLDKVSKAYDVDPEIVVSLLAMETGNGGFTGTTDIVQTLATLAWHGRRAEFYEEQLFAALKILDKGLIDKADYKGSWAGAFGETQFMPTTYLDYAQDFNKDGKIDLKNSKADAFASAANYIKNCGWKDVDIWGSKITLPKDIDAKYIGVKEQHSLETLKKLGVKTADGKPFPFSDDTMVSIAPYNADKGGTAYVVTAPFMAILKWNFSSYYGVSVLQTRDYLKGKTP